jgi:hypothetical protein
MQVAKEQYPVQFNTAISGKTDALGSFADLAVIDARQQELLADTSATTLAGDEEISRLEAELSAVKAGWAGKLAVVGAQTRILRTMANVRVGAYKEYIANGIENSTVEPEEVVYLRGLADGFVTRDSFNFPRAQEYLERYKTLQPGERVLVYSHFKNEPTARTHHIKDAGILAAKPKPLPFSRSELGFHNLELEFQYNNGRVTQHQVRHILDDSASFERAVASGAEVDEVVTAWSAYEVTKHEQRMAKDKEGLRLSSPLSIVSNLLLLSDVAAGSRAYGEIKAATLRELLAKPKVRVMDKFV